MRDTYPFVIDVGDMVRSGRNNLQVRVTPPPRNALVQRAMDGEKHLTHMREYEKTPIPVGLLGPVTLEYDLHALAADAP